MLSPHVVTINYRCIGYKFLCCVLFDSKGKFECDMSQLLKDALV